VIRLHLSESPFGPSPTVSPVVVAELARTAVYPDPARADLTGAIAAHYGVAPDRVAVANGSDELVLLTALALSPVGGAGLTTAGTFPGYRICLAAAGRAVHEVPLADGGPDVAGVLAMLPCTDIAYLCNPHNPTGVALPARALDRLVDAAEAADVPLVVDEAYAEFRDAGTPDLLPYVRACRDVLVLRTFSKAYGLAGFRVGYAIGRPERIAALRAVQGTVPFSVNRFALVAAQAALADQDHLAAVVRQNRDRREWLRAELARRGRPTRPTQTNFLLVPVRDSAAAERDLADRHQILVRDAGRFGLPGHLRVAVGAVPDLDRFLAALDLIDAPDVVDPLPVQRGLSRR
jgi:histidinol-phosphate aminotransferase